MTKSIIAERRGPSRYGVPCALSLAFCSIFTLAVSAHADIPSRPAERQSLHDLAGTISDADEQESRTMQQQVFDQVELPIVVVTVNRMHDYLPDASDIESFAPTDSTSRNDYSGPRGTSITLTERAGSRTWNRLLPMSNASSWILPGCGDSPGSGRVSQASFERMQAYRSARAAVSGKRRRSAPITIRQSAG